jgi:hypothetical protein
MNRRDLLATGGGLMLTGFQFCLASSAQVSARKESAADEGINPHAVLVPFAFTREHNSERAMPRFGYRFFRGVWNEH